MKDRSDFTPDTTPPRSIKDIVLEEISYTTYDGKTDNTLDVDSIDDLMQRVFARIEQQALEVYKSNEPWALRR